MKFEPLGNKWFGRFYVDYQTYWAPPRGRRVHGPMRWPWWKLFSIVNYDRGGDSYNVWVYLRNGAGYCIAVSKKS